MLNYNLIADPDDTKEAEETPTNPPQRDSWYTICLNCQLL